MENRKLCPECHQRPVAVNCIRNERRYYRRRCDVCSRKRKHTRIAPPGWRRSGYSKKNQCELCGFRAQYPEQLGVFYVDGNLKNNNWLNLKTVCLNCQLKVYKSRLKWAQDPIE
jgi:hypothetical protein